MIAGHGGTSSPRSRDDSDGVVEVVDAEPPPPPIPPPPPEAAAGVAVEAGGGTKEDMEKDAERGASESETCADIDDKTR